MKNTGFVITSSSRRTEFFTSSSAYDNAQWIPLKEATVYYSTDIAEKAVANLRKHGYYGATVVPLAEFDLGSEPTPPVTSGTDMSAHNKGDVCPKCSHDPCTCPPADEDDDSSDDDLDTPTEDTPEEPAEIETEYEVETVADPSSRAMSKGEVEPRVVPGSRREVKEGEEVQVIKYNTPDTGYSNASDGVRNDEVPATKYKVPAIVIADLKKAIDEHTKNADIVKDHANGVEEGTMCLTIANACQTLLDYLTLGTEEGFKLAQVTYTSLMSPITTKIPSTISDFLLTCCKKSLKEMFNEKREAVRLAEVERSK